MCCPPSLISPTISFPIVLQLPEPLISFRLYHELVGLAKDNLKAEAEAKAASRGARQDRSQSEAAAVAMAGRLRELLQDLPWENRATLQYLLRHLRRSGPLGGDLGWERGRGSPGATHTLRSFPTHRVVEVEQDNKMTPGNLGIVFGPTLLRPRPTDATVSLSSLVDYPHQARVIETLITQYSLVFGDEPEEGLRTQVGLSQGCAWRMETPPCEGFGLDRAAAGWCLPSRELGKIALACAKALWAPHPPLELISDSP